MKISGIYKIINKINGKIYYGSSVNINHRFNQHRCDLNKNKHINSHLQSAWNKYGKENFDFKIHEEICSDKLEIVEQFYLNKCKLSPEKYYNIGYDSVAPSRGRKASAETLKRMSISRIGFKHSKETKEKMSRTRKGKSGKWNIGRKLSEGHKKKLRDVGKGRVMSNETRIKISKNHSRFWKGKHLSDETKQKMSKSHLKPNLA